ncbi:hypothetical protein E8E12_010982 [Didymella heteroderae]|uniref:Uncharacterized protein n=1 Tax=Didymella heteroderae TaxID=1769908 RepID=A0A9P5C4L1_9PLEO|nr:hypothetical protein E8E12_010982 [Didymella heteroderae]
MSTNSHRAIESESTVGAQAQMLNARAPDSSPIFPTPVKRELFPPPSSHFDAPITRVPSVAQGSLVGDSHSALDTSPAPELIHEAQIHATSSPSHSPCPKLRLTPHTTERASPKPRTLEYASTRKASILSFPSISFSSGLKLKLRGIQAAIKESPNTTDSSSVPSDTSTTRKRTSIEATFDDDFDTDSEIDFMPPSRKVIKPTIEQPAKRTASRRAKKVKTIHGDSDYGDDAIFDAGDEQSSPNSSSDSKLILSSNVLKRAERMLDPTNPDHAKLIAAATKAGSEYYDSDAEELPGNVKETNKPHLFRNVKWGSLATDYSNPEDFTTEPEFTQFVPGRFERLPDGTTSDQKQKLIIKLTDKQHRQRIFLNPPPRDWNNQEAITALNKRTVQQIRRNTSVRFREVVEPYVKEEREWILAHLTDGKPTGGWKKFVNAFNREFEGKTWVGCSVARPERSHSSLTKEVERFGAAYAKGIVPKTVSQAKGTKKGRK